MGIGRGNRQLPTDRRSVEEEKDILGLLPGWPVIVGCQLLCLVSIPLCSNPLTSKGEGWFENSSSMGQISELNQTDYIEEQCEKDFAIAVAEGWLVVEDEA